MNTRIQAQAGGSSFRPLAILFGLGLLSFSTLAAPPNPPALFLTDGDNTNRIEEILGNYTRPSNLVALQYPADPVTTTTHEVRNNSELSAAIGSGRLIRIYGPANGGQATYNQFNLSNLSDIDIVMDNDATITGGSGWRWGDSGRVRRLRWTGGNVQFTSSGSGLTITDIEDALFDDVRMFKNSGVNGHILLFQSGIRYAQRVAIINSTVEHLGTGFDYAIFSGGNLAATSGNWVLANNRLIGQATPMRMMWLGQYAAFVNNYVSGFNGQGWRLHWDMSDVWIEDNVITHTVSGSRDQPLMVFQADGENGGDGPPMERFRIFNNHYYATQSDFNAGSVYRFGGITGASDDYPEWELRDNTWHDPTGPTTPGSWGNILIRNAYVREGEIRIGPGNPAYQIPPPPGDFGARR